MNPMMMMMMMPSTPQFYYCIYPGVVGTVMYPYTHVIPSAQQMQGNPLATPVGYYSGVNPGFVYTDVYCPTIQPQHEAPLLQKKVRIQDPKDNRDVMAEIFRERMTSAQTPTQIPPMEDPGQQVDSCLTPNEEAKPPVPEEPSAESLPASEQEPDPVSPVSDAPSSAPLTPPEPEESDVVEDAAPSLEAEPNTSPVTEVMCQLNETHQPEQKRRKRPGQLLFCIPPMEEMQKKKIEKVSKSEDIKDNKEKHHRRPGLLLFCIPPTEGEQQKTEQADTPVKDRQDVKVTFWAPEEPASTSPPASEQEPEPEPFTPTSDAPSPVPLSPPEAQRSVIVEAPLTPVTTPPKEAEPTTCMSPVSGLRSCLKKIPPMDHPHKQVRFCLKVAFSAPEEPASTSPPASELEPEPVTPIPETPSSSPLSPPKPKWNDIVKASQTMTPQKTVEPKKAGGQLGRGAQRRGNRAKRTTTAVIQPHMMTRV